MGARAAARLALALSLTLAPNAFALDYFIAPAGPSRSVDVRLFSTEGVAPGQEELVTFDFPFACGSVAVPGFPCASRFRPVVPWT